MRRSRRARFSAVYSYGDRREAIERANSLDVAFQAAVYTRDLEIAHDTAKRLDAAAVMINDHTAFRVDWMPFAGRRSSGYGVGGIGYSMRDMVQAKMVAAQRLPRAPRRRSPFPLDAIPLCSSIQSPRPNSQTRFPV